MALLGVSFAMSFVAASLLTRSSRPDARPVERRPSRELKATLVVVYFGSSDCKFADTSESRQLVRDLFAELRQTATDAGMTFVAVGIAAGRNLDREISHLKKVAPFDQLVVGGQLTNLGLRRYMLEHFPGQVSTPQVIALHAASETGSPPEEQLLARRIGILELKEWRDAGLPLPGIQSARPGTSAQEIRRLKGQPLLR